MRVALLIAAMAAAGYTARLAIFMFDHTRGHYSVLDRTFFRGHSCLSSYTEAVRLAPTGANVFDPAHYVGMPAPGQFVSRYIGPFEVDLYQYPPPFLVLPYAAFRTGLDFFTVRTIWFVLQFGILLGGMIVTARWIGGTPGTIAALFIPLTFLAPTTRVALQIGNFQVTAFPLAVLGMIAFHRSHHALGGLALGFAAVSKIFPGILGIVLLWQRRWTAVAVTTAAGAAVVALALMTVGPKPFVDFVQYQLPRIESGEAFFWIEEPVMAPVNQSVYGLVTKLRALGLPGTGVPTANAASSLYALLLVPLAIVGVRRLQRLPDRGEPGPLARLRQAQLWLGLLSLASFRSPFVPDAYGLVGTLWLLTLIAAERQRLTEWTALVIAGAAFSVVFDGGLVPSPVPLWMVLATLGIQLAAYGINLFVVLTPHRAATLAPEPETAVQMPSRFTAERATAAETFRTSILGSLRSLRSLR